MCVELSSILFSPVSLPVILLTCVCIFITVCLIVVCVFYLQYALYNSHFWLVSFIALFNNLTMKAINFSNCMNVCSYFPYTAVGKFLFFNVHVYEFLFEIYDNHDYFFISQ